MNTREEILKYFCNKQCKMWEGKLFLNDECYLVEYRHLIDETKRTKEELKPMVLELRNERLIELVTAFDMDCEFRRGSGYILTNKGVELCSKLKLHDEFPPLTPISIIK